MARTGIESRGRANAAAKMVFQLELKLIYKIDIFIYNNEVQIYMVWNEVYNEAWFTWVWLSRLPIMEIKKSKSKHKTEKEKKKVPRTTLRARDAIRVWLQLHLCVVLQWC
jgi:endonuclease/exonuclease/phosphatase family metal-dependent hydrolase